MPLRHMTQKCHQSDRNSYRLVISLWRNKCCASETHRLHACYTNEIEEEKWYRRMLVWVSSRLSPRLTLNFIDLSAAILKYFNVFCANRSLKNATERSEEQLRKCFFQHCISGMCQLTLLLTRLVNDISSCCVFLQLTNLIFISQSLCSRDEFLRRITNQKQFFRFCIVISV